LSIDVLLPPVEKKFSLSQDAQSKLQKIEENFNPKRITELKLNQFSNTILATIQVASTEIYEIKKNSTNDVEKYKFVINKFYNAEAFFCEGWQ
jgi:hypothetical protein